MIVTDRASGARRLAILRLTLSDFRCYRFLRMDMDSRPVVLTGPNGAGKTNILEALSLLTPGRGMRGARIAEIGRRDAGEGAAWGVAAVLGGPDGEVEIATGREAGAERRSVRIDGQPARNQMVLGETVSAIWLTPAMDRLFLEGSAGRRRFLDRLVLGADPGHAARAAAYEHALRERARLLRAGGADARWLATLEEAMAERGAAMAAARRSAVGRLNTRCAAGRGPFPAAALTVAGVEEWLDEDGEEGVAGRLRQALAASRRRDAEAGGAAEGPHRSDLKVVHVANGVAAENCSTGEQKALLIAILLAHAQVLAQERGAAPILLLDEVAAHLDADRRAALFDELRGLDAQSWLTGTDEAVFAGLGADAQFFRVAAATATRVAQ